MSDQKGKEEQGAKRQVRRPKRAEEKIPVGTLIKELTRRVEDMAIKIDQQSDEIRELQADKEAHTHYIKRLLKRNTLQTSLYSLARQRLGQGQSLRQVVDRFFSSSENASAFDAFTLDRFLQTFAISVSDEDPLDIDIENVIENGVEFGSEDEHPDLSNPLQDVLDSEEDDG